MRRALLVLATVLLALGAIGAVTHAVEANADAPLISQTAVPASCQSMTPTTTNNLDVRCRDYLYQIKCQFEPKDPEWGGWCGQNKDLQEGTKAEVPACGVGLAAAPTTVAVRCRDYLAHETCTHSHGAEFDDFCTNLAPNAGPDPRCTKATQKLCGPQPIIQQPACYRGLAVQDTPAGKACKELLWRDECEAPVDRNESTQAWCDQEAEKRKKPLGQKGPEQRAAPPQPGKDAGPNPGQPDVLSQLGREPDCSKSGLSQELQLSCSVTGSVMHKYPFANYGIDNNVSVSIGDDHFFYNAIMSVLQWILVAAWMILIWLVKMALLLLQWAFGVDPLARTESSGDLAASVLGLFKAIGPEWRLTALAILGVWGFWNGLVRRQFMQTLSGMLVSVLMMIAAMVIVYAPGDTVGLVAKYANESAAMVLSSTSAGTPTDPGQRNAQDQQTLFDQFVVGPWCALQFGSEATCNEPLPGHEDDPLDKRPMRRDLWLAMPANSSAREMLYEATIKGPQAVLDRYTDRSFWDELGDYTCALTFTLSQTCDGVKDIFQTAGEEEMENDPLLRKAAGEALSLVKQKPESVTLQGPDGVFSRFGLLVLIVVGVLFAVLFFVLIGVRLLAAGVIVLLLIMLAPVMLIVAAFGEEGRRRFIAWLKMLAGATFAKLVFALLLGVVLRVDFLLTSTAGARGDWIGSWLLVTAFFIVAVTQMNRVLSLIAPDPAQSGRQWGASDIFYMQRMLSGPLRGIRRAAAMPRRALPRLGRIARREREIGREATDETIRDRADRELGARTETASQRHQDRTLDSADKAVAAPQNRRRRLATIDRHLGDKTLSEPRRKALEAQRDKLRRELPELQEGARHGRAMQRKQQAKGDAGPSAWDQRSRRAERELDVRRWRQNPEAWTGSSNQDWAGISNKELESARRAERGGNAAPMQELRERSEAALRRDSTLFGLGNRNEPISRQTRADELRGLKPGALGYLSRDPRDREFRGQRSEQAQKLRRKGRANLRKKRVDR